MTFDYEINPNSKYVAAVSFGPDSMALLHMLIMMKANVIVAHVNYHKRPESDFEEESLRKFCKENNVPIEVLDLKDQKSTKNFQDWARKVRYEFFKKLSEKVDAEAVFVAHQEDDVIETFLMQKNRGNIVKNWGIAKEIDIFGVHIVRPLLSFSKSMLKDYCDYNKVPYSIDSSNLENKYARNLIRHTVVENMNDEQRNKIVDEIRHSKSLTSDSQYQNPISLEEFLEFDDEMAIRFIDSFLSKRNLHIDISKKFIDEMKKAFKSKKSNVQIRLIEGMFISKEYDEVFLYSENEVVDYCFVMDSPSRIENKFFEIDFTNNGEERNIKKDSYPITIRPVKLSDAYRVNNYDCLMRRLFIDWKVPPHLRKCWPGIYDKSNKLIYVPRYRKEFKDNHKSKFIIKFTKAH